EIREARRRGGRVLVLAASHADAIGTTPAERCLRRGLRRGLRRAGARRGPCCTAAIRHGGPRWTDIPCPPRSDAARQRRAPRGLIILPRQSAVRIGRRGGRLFRG